MSSSTNPTLGRAVEVLKGNIVKEGLRASTVYYNQIWARDAFISLIGANLLHDEGLLSCARDTVSTFARTASPMGQIPNFYDLKSQKPEYGYSGSTDSTSWYIIGLASLYAATEDGSLLKDPLRIALQAYRWLRYQDANNSWLIDSPAGADWMDAAVQRTGKTLYNNALYLMATLSIERLVGPTLESADRGIIPNIEELKQRFSDVFLPGEGSAKRMAAYWPRLSEVYDKGMPIGYGGEYYLHYVSFSRVDTHFDTLSNLLCILSGLADSPAVERVLDTIRSRSLAEPYPARVLDPPYTSEGVSFHTDFDSSLPVQHQSGPYAYHNGGVWPFVGGLYVASLFLRGHPEAGKELESLSEANSRFREG
ncbi:MAG TPA: amylo-alpha-1,6-glucosidase, partial [Nitrososphaerales archaeon]|nr:amylo-alpha-1,6-glucosidase [Nitrososphaerales archaeon]